MAERARIDFPSRIGVWWASDTWPMQAAQEVASEIEALGYGSLFLPEEGERWYAVGFDVSVAL